MPVNFEKDFYESIKGTSEFEVPFSDSTVKKGDPGFIYYISDVIASEYGLGGCKTLQEFVDMVDSTDPVLLDGLLAYMAKRNQEQSQDGKHPPEEIDKEEYIDDSKTGMEESQNKNNTVVKEMLFRFGVSKDDLNSALEKIDKRKINTLKDYTWLNKQNNLENLSDVEFREVLKSMRKDKANSVNFKVSMESLMERERGKVGQ